MPDTTTTTDTSTTDTTSTDSTSTDTTSTTSQLVAKTKEVEIDNYKDAYKFAKLEYFKALRDDKHTLECKVIGSNKWKQGKWVYCYIPDYFIDSYMYITKASHEISDSGVWTTSLTLQDYPPSLSSGESNDPTKQTDTSTTDDTETDNGSTSTENSSTSTDTTSTTG